MLSRSRAFGKARARAAEKTQENKLPKFRGWGGWGRGFSSLVFGGNFGRAAVVRLASASPPVTG